MAEDGQYYSYLPDTGEKADFVNNLLSSEMEGHVLGGKGSVEPWWVAQNDAMDYLPYLLAPLVAFGGYKLIDRSDDDSDDNSNLFITSQKIFNDSIQGVVTDKDGGVIANSAVSVVLTSGKKVEAVTDKNGFFLLPVKNMLADGEMVEIIAKKDGKTVTAKVLNLDPTMSEDGKSVTGKAPAGSKISIDIDGDGVADSNTVADNNGNYQAEFTTPVKKADVNVQTPDEIQGNGSVSKLNNLVGNVAADGSSIKVSNATPGEKVTVTDEQGNVIGSAVTGADGTVTLPLSKPLTNGEKINITTPTETGNAVAPVQETVIPAPTISAQPDGSVTTTPSNDATQQTVTYTDDNGNQQTVTVIKDPNSNQWTDPNPNDGISVDPSTGTVTIPADAVKDGTDVTSSQTTAPQVRSATPMTQPASSSTAP